MDGIGAVITSSPTSCTTSLPAPSHAPTGEPSDAHEISPIHTGTVGAEPTNAAHTSVPPETEQIWIRSPTASPIHRKPSSDRGAPVDPMALMEETSYASPGVSPALRHDWT